MKNCLETGLLFNIDEFDVDPEFIPDDYETPDGTGGSMKLAQAFAGLVASAPGEKILDCSAGSGRVAQFLPPATTCIEMRDDRVVTGRHRAPHCTWVQGNFLKLSLYSLGRKEPFKFILTNPPFSIACDFLAHCHQLLAPSGRVMLLLPINYFSTVEHAEAIAALEADGLKRERIYQIKGRVAYLKGDVPQRGRQCDDAIHVFTWDSKAVPAITTLNL